MNKELDKFYTSDEAASSFIGFIKKNVDIHSFDNIIEPSAGAGALLNHIPSDGPKIHAIDLLPERDDITQCDFFDFVFPEGKNIVIGNPPFGKRSKLAIEFFNRCAEHADVIAFIIPVTWEKYSIHKQLADDWALIANERLPEASFELGGKPYKVRCTMQVWVRGDADSLRLTSRPTGENEFFEFVSKDEATLAIRQAYPKTVEMEDVDGQSHYFIKPKVAGVEDVFRSVIWEGNGGRAMLDGVSVPCLDKDTVVKFYLKYANLRKNQPEVNTHPDFIIKQGYNPNATFVIRGVRPKVSNEVDVFERIDPSTRFYSVEPLVDGVEETFRKVEWHKHWQGTSMPTVSISDCVEVYKLYKD